MAQRIDSFCTLSDFGTFEVGTADGQTYVITTKPCVGRVVEVTGGPDDWDKMDAEVRRDVIAIDDSIEFIYPLPDRKTAHIRSILRLS